MKVNITLVIFYLVVIIIFNQGCKKRKATLFTPISSDHSGIYFNNKIVENDTLNPLDVTNMYNGGGVGIGDFNNDGLPDIYFTGSRVSNKM